MRLLFIGALSLAFMTSGFCELNKADELIAQNKLVEAEKLVDQVLSGNPTDLESLTRKSRLIALKADQMEDKDKKVALYEEAEKIASKVVENHPKSAKGYLRRAAASGKLALFKGILESRTLILAVKDDASKALEQSSATDYEKALASYILGRAHLKLAEKPRVMRIPLGLGWASKKEGSKLLQKAAELAPESIPFNLDYAKWLIDNDKKSKAKGILEKIAGLKVIDPADPKHQEEAKKLLSEL